MTREERRWDHLERNPHLEERRRFDLVRDIAKRVARRMRDDVQARANERAKFLARYGKPISKVSVGVLR